MPPTQNNLENHINIENSNTLNPQGLTSLDYDSQANNRYFEASKGPYLVYITDKDQNNNLGNYHIISIGAKLFDAGYQAEALQREGHKCFSVAFSSHSIANEFVKKGVSRVDPNWRAFIPDVGLYNIGIILDVSPELHIDKLAQGSSCSEGEAIHKFVRSTREIQTDQGPRNINLEKVKIYCKGVLPKYINIFGIF